MVILQFAQVFSRGSIGGVGVRGMGSGRVHYALAERSLRSERVGVDRLTCKSTGTGDLFGSVMRRTGCRFNFRAGSVPLVIRTVPLPSRSVILVVAGIRCPSRLSAEFSGFSRTSSSFASLKGTKRPPIVGKTTSVLRLFRHVGGRGRGATSDRRDASSVARRRTRTSMIGLFIFSGFSSIHEVSRILSNFCDNEGSLCHSTSDGGCCLITRGDRRAPGRFGGIYGVVSRCTCRGGCIPTGRTFFGRRNGIVVRRTTVRALTMLWRGVSYGWGATYVDGPSFHGLARIIVSRYISFGSGVVQIGSIGRDDLFSYLRL